MAMQDRRSSLTRRKFGNWLTRAEKKGDRKRAERHRVKIRLKKGEDDGA